MDKLITWDPLDLSHWGKRGLKDMIELRQVFETISGACAIFLDTLLDANNILSDTWNSKPAWYLLWAVNGHLEIAFQQVFDVVAETRLVGDCANTIEQRGLKEAFAQAKEEADLLRTQIAIYIESALANGSKLEIKYAGRRAYLGLMTQG